MQNLTEAPTFPVGTLPPPTPARPTPPNVISQAGVTGQAPMLPLATVTPPKPPAAPASSPFATSLNPTPPPRAPQQHQGPGSRRRIISWLVLLSLLGGVAYVAIVHGPELMERATGERIDEPEAPLAFPVARVPAPPVRTASYVVERTDAFGVTTAYAITSDFESGLAQLTIERGESPDIEMMAVFDEAVVRRADHPQWFRLARGDFPIDASAGRARWIRTLDELLPQALRSQATIERATESVVDNVPTRRLLVSLDPQALVAATTAPPPGDTQTAPAAVLPPGISLRPDADVDVPLQLELWIDDSGLVRKLVLPPALGGETITVTSVSAEPLQAMYPAPEQVEPLTAQALLALGS
jgi:hypothetical protein